MIHQKYVESPPIDYKNGVVEKMNVYDNFYYDSKNVLKCPKCNNLIFYVENKFAHKCSSDNDEIIFDLGVIKSNSNEFKCDINKIGNVMCVKHKKEFSYYKDMNYYCSSCIKEKKLKDFLNLDFITLSNKEINDFEKK